MCKSSQYKITLCNISITDYKKTGEIIEIAIRCEGRGLGGWVVDLRKIEVNNKNSFSYAFHEIYIQSATLTFSYFFLLSFLQYKYRMVHLNHLNTLNLINQEPRLEWMVNTLDFFLFFFTSFLKTEY